MSQGFQYRIRPVRATFFEMYENAVHFVGVHLDLFKRLACGVMVGSAVAAASLFTPALRLTGYYLASLGIFACSTTAFTLMYHTVIAENGLWGLGGIVVTIVLTLLSRPPPEGCTQFLPLVVVLVILGTVHAAPWIKNIIYPRYNLSLQELGRAEEGSYSSGSNQATYNGYSDRSIGMLLGDMGHHVSTDSHPLDFLHIGTGTLETSRDAEVTGDFRDLDLESRLSTASSVYGQSTHRLL